MSSVGLECWCARVGVLSMNWIHVLTVLLHPESIWAIPDITFDVHLDKAPSFPMFSSILLSFFLKGQVLDLDPQGNPCFHFLLFSLFFFSVDFLDVLPVICNSNTMLTMIRF